MIREYLGQVSTAATRRLPKGDRLLFVGRTRAAIEAQVGPLASADDAEAVAAALTALGDPDELAAKERERLYSTRRRGAAAEPPTLWKPPGKTRRRGATPGQPPRGGSAETPPRSGSAGTQPPGGPGDTRPRRSRPWPYRRSEADDPALPGPAGPAAAEPGAAAGPGAAGPGAAGSGATGPRPADGGGTPPAAPGGAVHIPAPRQPESPGPTVGPGMSGTRNWLASPGTVGPGMPPRTDASAGLNGAAGPGTSNGTAGPGANHGTAGPGALNGTAPSGQNGTAPGSTPPGGPAGDTAPGPSVGPADPGRPATGPGPAAAPDTAAEDDTAGHVVPPDVGRPDGTTPLSIVPGMEPAAPAADEPAERRFGVPAPLTEAWTLARNNPLEAVAVLLLGVGGLIYPFPLWLIAGLLALLSRKWVKRDKWLALAGPVGFAAICMLLLGISGSGGFFHALGQATHQFGLLLRIGCVLCAGYLVWRLRRGKRRRKQPPWLRIR